MLPPPGLSSLMHNWRRHHQHDTLTYNIRRRSPHTACTHCAADAVSISPEHHLFGCSACARTHVCGALATTRGSNQRWFAPDACNTRTNAEGESTCVFSGCVLTETMEAYRNLGSYAEETRSRGDLAAASYDDYDDYDDALHLMNSNWDLERAQFSVNMRERANALAASVTGRAHASAVRNSDKFSRAHCAATRENRVVADSSPGGDRGGGSSTDRVASPDDSDSDSDDDDDDDVDDHGHRSRTRARWGNMRYRGFHPAVSMPTRRDTRYWDDIYLTGTRALDVLFHAAGGAAAAAALFADSGSIAATAAAATTPLAHKLPPRRSSILCWYRGLEYKLPYAIYARPRKWPVVPEEWLQELLVTLHALINHALRVLDRASELACRRLVRTTTVLVDTVDHLARWARLMWLREGRAIIRPTVLLGVYFMHLGRAPVFVADANGVPCCIASPTLLVRLLGRTCVVERAYLGAQHRSLDAALAEYFLRQQTRGVRGVAFATAVAEPAGPRVAASRKRKRTDADGDAAPAADGEEGDGDVRDVRDLPFIEDARVSLAQLRKVRELADTLLLEGAGAAPWFEAWFHSEHLRCFGTAAVLADSGGAGQS